jgi:hypothetical protein
MYVFDDCNQKDFFLFYCGELTHKLGIEKYVELRTGNREVE